MKNLIITLMFAGLHISLFAQDIFRTNLQGIFVQTFSSGNPIDGFSIGGPDEEGFVYLVVHAGTSSGEILRTKWQGTKVQAFFPSQAHVISGFDTESDGQFVYLVALGSDGSRGQIIMTKYQGSAIQALSDSNGMGFKTISASGPDSDGFVRLSVSSAEEVEEPDEREPEQPKSDLIISGGICKDQTKISYFIERNCRVKMGVYDATGRIVVSLMDKKSKQVHMK